MLWGVRECLCLASADSQSWCVFLHFAVEEAETPPAHVAEVTGSLTRSTQPAPYYELCLPFPLRIKIFLQNNIAHPEWVHKRLSTISVVTLGLKMLPFAISLLSSENSHLYNIHHLKRFVALLSDFFFFFCIELWFCCRMQNTSQGWQTNGEPVLDINLWFSGKTHSKCKSCYWEHIVMIHHVNICLAA